MQGDDTRDNSAAEVAPSMATGYTAFSRREFLGLGACSSAALAAHGLSVAPAHAAARPIPAIDTHAHFYDPTRPQGVPWPPKSDEVLYKPRLPKQFREASAGLGIAGVVVVEASAWVQDNQWVLDLARDNDLIVGFVGHLDPAAPEFAANLNRLAANPLFRGVRFDEGMLAKGIGQPVFEANLNAIAEHNLTLDVVGGPTMLPLVARVAKLAPKLRVVIDHLPLRDWGEIRAAMNDVLRELSSLPKVYAKVSDLVRRVDGRTATDPAYYFPILDDLRELYGPDRTMFGSNWPVSDLMAPYATVHQVVADYYSQRPAAEAERFFWRNSLAAYRWVPRGEAAKLVVK